MSSADVHKGEAALPKNKRLLTRAALSHYGNMTSVIYKVERQKKLTAIMDPVTSTTLST